MLFIRTWPKYLKLVTNSNFWSKANCGKLTHSDLLEHLGLTTMQTVFWVFIRISYLVHTVFSMEMPWVSMTYHCHPEHSHKQWRRLHRAPWTANNKLAKLYWPSRKKFFLRFAPDGSLSLSNSSGTTGHKPVFITVDRPTASFLSWRWGSRSCAPQWVNSDFKLCC